MTYDLLFTMLMIIGMAVSCGYLGFMCGVDHGYRKGRHDCYKFDKWSGTN